MKIPMNAFSRTIETLLRTGSRSSTLYLDDHTRVTATHIRKPHKRDKATTIVVTYGAMNYAGREFVRACKRAGEPFPVKRPQLKDWPVRKEKS